MATDAVGSSSEARPQILSYGGGRQTVAICLLIAREILPRPDRIVIADTGRENPSTWEYLEQYTQPLMRSIGLEIDVAPRSLATVDLHGKNGQLLIPVYTDTGKLSAYCSNEWKAYVVERHLRATYGIVAAEFWIGFAIDESRRIKSQKPGPRTKKYPLADLMLTKLNCRNLIQEHGWPLPEVSSCWMCPNKHNSEWAVIRERYPDKWAEACQLDDELRIEDRESGRSGVYLHHSRVPLREADLSQPDPHEALQCGLGTCFI